MIALSQHPARRRDDRSDDLSLLLTASVGVLIPMTLLCFGRDRAMGSSVMITALTDSGGFLIFLGLTTLFLI